MRQLILAHRDEVRADDGDVGRLQQRIQEEADVSEVLVRDLLALLFGVAVGNAMQGMPIGPDKEFQGGTLDLVAPGTGKPYEDFLVYVDSTFTGLHPNCKINGSAADTFIGLIYAPNCDVELAGTSSPTGTTWSLAW